MHGEPDIPQGVGPHEGRELELMLSGEKPLALFPDIVPSSYGWPDPLFEPYVVSGVLLKKEFFTKTADERHTVRHLYFALPHEAWRIDEAHSLSLKHFDAWCSEAEGISAQIGRLLGYSETEIQSFVNWARKSRELTT
ncbi:MAG: hypothetical protein ISR47_03630 [Rhodospirillales bacterium]|nr:hypothetical protein [Rhodospirillales bacterium]